MKATIELTEHEIQQAIRSYVEAGGMKANWRPTAEVTNV